MERNRRHVNLIAAGEGFRLPAVQVVERMPGVDLPFVKVDDYAAALAVRALTIACVSVYSRK